MELASLVWGILQLIYVMQKAACAHAARGIRAQVSILSALEINVCAQGTKKSFVRGIRPEWERALRKIMFALTWEYAVVGDVF